MTDTTPPTDTIELRHVAVWVCDLCLQGQGGECHVPGCLFYMHEQPASLPELASPLGTLLDRYRTAALSYGDYDDVDYIGAAGPVPDDEDEHALANITEMHRVLMVRAERLDKAHAEIDRLRTLVEGGQPDGDKHTPRRWKDADGDEWVEAEPPVMLRMLRPDDDTTLRAYLNETCAHHWQWREADGDVGAHRQCLWCNSVIWAEVSR